jgi:LysM repeat protein
MKLIRQPKAQLTLIISGLLLIILILLLSELSSNTVLGSKDIDIKHVSILIQKNDSLWSLSQEFNSTDIYSTNEFIDYVIKINGLSSEKIYIGQRVTIPLVTEIAH